MALTLNTDDATAILVPDAGWLGITPGSLEFGPLEIEGEGSVYGFTADLGDGRVVTGRLSALLAVTTPA